MLYADSKATSLLEFTPYDSFAHALLPWLPSEKVSIFSNFPLTALILAPLACFGPDTAFVLITVVQLIVVFFCAGLIAGEKKDRSVAKIAWLSLSFLPVTECLLMGQIDILIGLLPIVWGFCVCFEGELYLAGLIWSLTFLKMQFLLMPLIVALSLAAAKKPACLAGILTGIAALLCFAAMVTSGETLNCWVHQLRLLSATMTDWRSVHANYLFAALGPCVVAIVPANFKLFAGQLVLAVTSVFALAALIKCRKKLVNEPLNKALPPVTLMGLYLTPIVSPYLFFYSLSFFWLAGVLAFTSKFAKYVSPPQRRTVKLTWLLVNVYFLSCFGSAMIDPHRVLAVPLLLTLPLAILAVHIFSSL